MTMIRMIELTQNPLEGSQSNPYLGKNNPFLSTTKDGSLNPIPTMPKQTNSVVYHPSVVDQIHDYSLEYKPLLIDLLIVCVVLLCAVATVKVWRLKR